MNRIIVITTICLGLLVSACSTSRIQSKSKPANGTEEEYGSASVKSKKADSLALARVYIDACRAKALGDYETAIQLFGEVLQMEPLNDAALYELGRIYFEFGKLEDAREMLRLASSQDPENTYYLDVYGNALLYLAQYNEAAGIFRKLIQLQPENVDAWYELAFAQERAGYPNESIETLSQLEKQLGPDENIRLEQYRIYIRNGRLEEAIQKLLDLIAYNPYEPVYYGMLVEAYEMNEQMDSAETTLKTLLKIDPDNADLLFKKAEFQRKSGDYSAYIATLTEVFGNPEADVDKKIFFFIPYVDSVGNPAYIRTETILHMASLVVATHPTEAKTYAVQGDLLQAAGKTADARHSYLQSTNLRGDVYDVWVQLFYLDADAQQWDSLKSVTQRSIDLFPNQALGYYFNGVACQNNRQPETAVLQFKRALPMAGSNSSLKAEIWFRLGDTYHLMEQHEASDDAYRQSLAIDPNNPYTLNNFAYYLSQRGVELELAANMAEKANKLVPNNASLLDTWAWVLFRQGKFDAAADKAQLALKAGGEQNAVLLEHYGDILFKLGKTEQAVLYWQKAVEYGGKGAVLENKIRNQTWYE